MCTALYWWWLNKPLSHAGSWCIKEGWDSPPGLIFLKHYVCILRQCTALRFFSINESENCPRTPDFCLGSERLQKLWDPLYSSLNTNVTFTFSVPNSAFHRILKTSWPSFLASPRPLSPAMSGAGLEWQWARTWCSGVCSPVGIAYHLLFDPGQVILLLFRVGDFVLRRDCKLCSVKAPDGAGVGREWAGRNPAPYPPITHTCTQNSLFFHVFIYWTFA